ncbi:hypothetical protein QSI_4797 [Clostridioides difficile P28]|nr:hypothetical protein QSI_4797 [Clostridioides difficile P28]
MKNMEEAMHGYHQLSLIYFVHERIVFSEKCRAVIDWNSV